MFWGPHLGHPSRPGRPNRLTQPTCQLPHNGSPAQIVERVALIESRVQDRTIWKLLAGLMVVCNDNLHSKLPGKLDLINSRDPAIDGHDQRSATLGQLPHIAVAEPIPVRDSVRDQPVAVDAKLAQRSHQDGRRADPVDVEVPMHRDPPFLFDDGQDRLQDRPHRLERLRRMHLVGVEERPSLLGRPIAPPDERDGNRLAHAEVRREPASLLVRVGLGLVCAQGLCHARRLGSASDRILGALSPKQRPNEHGRPAGRPCLPLSREAIRLL